MPNLESLAELINDPPAMASEACFRILFITPPVHRSSAPPCDRYHLPRNAGSEVSSCRAFSRLSLVQGDRAMLLAMPEAVERAYISEDVVELAQSITQLEQLFSASSFTTF